MATPNLPSQPALLDPKSDVRGVFEALTASLKFRPPDPEKLDGIAASISLEYRRSVFTFLVGIPDKKRLFENKAKELVRELADRPAWLLDLPATERGAATNFGRRRGSVDSGLGDSDMATPAIATEASSLLCRATEDDAGRARESLSQQRAEAPSLARLAAVSDEVLAGMPPAEAFLEKNGYDERDTFIDFRSWAMKKPHWQLSAAGSKLDPSVRRSIFALLIRRADIKLFSRQAREVLNLLISFADWVKDDVVDDVARDRILGGGDVTTTPRMSLQEEARKTWIRSGALPAGHRERSETAPPEIMPATCTKADTDNCGWSESGHFDKCYITPIPSTVPHRGDCATKNTRINGDSATKSIQMGGSSTTHSEAIFVRPPLRSSVSTRGIASSTFVL